MDSIKNILLELQEVGANVSVHGDSLRIDSGKGLISDRLKLSIKTHKNELVNYINSIRKGYSVIPAIEKKQDYALSSSQRRLWALSQIEEINLTFNIPVAYWFEGKLDIAALAYSFNTLIERHEILRTVFREDANGEIRQCIKAAEETGFGISYHDLRKEEAREQQLQSMVQQQFTQVFNLSTGPLLRASLYQVEDNKWVFIYVMHHIISDGWSTGILMNELLLFYNAHVKKQDNPLSPLRIHYKDYAAWQQQQLEGGQLAIHKAYWLHQLGDTLPILDLQGDRPRPTVQTYNGRVVTKVISEGITKRIKALSQEQGGTLFMGLMSAVNMLLYRHTGQEDIIIGSPIAGREHADLEDQIGLYLNTLALRTRFKANESFEALFTHIKQVTLGAYEHQVYPFDELVDALQLKRNAGRNVLFDVMVLLQNFNMSTAASQEPGDIQISKYEGGEQVVSKYDLVFYFNETGEEITTNIEYNTDIFNRDTIVRLGDYLESLLAAITEQPSASVDELVMNAMGKSRLPVKLEEAVEATTGCSEHQKRLWFIDQFERNYLYEGSPVYHNLPLIVKLSADIDVEALRASVQKVVNAHNILRTRIISENSEPLQVIDEVIDVKITSHELGDITGQELEEKSLVIVERPFEIGTEPLVRFDLIHYNNNERVFIITAHHAVADRQSLRIIFNAIISDYKASTEAGTTTASYAAFAGWQNGLSAGELEATSYYWKRKLANAPVLYLDTDTPREHIHIYKAALSQTQLGTELSDKIESFCRAQGVSPFLFFLTAFKALLNRYTGSDEIVIGTLHANRQQEVLESMVGPLANLLTLKTNVRSEAGFTELLGQVSADYSSSVQYSAMPFEKVVLEINPGKDMSRTALFDVMIHFDESATNGFEEVELNRGLGKYDLNLLVKQDKGYGLYLTFNEKYFNASRIERLLGYYTRIVEQVLIDPHTAINEIDFVSAEEKQQLIAGFNNTEASYPTDATIVSLFEEQAARTPANVAVVFEGTSLTYAELNEKSNRLANYLSHHYSIAPDDLVGIKLDRSLEMIIAIIAILKSGGAYVPIDPAYPQERIDYMIQDSQCKVVIDEKELAAFYAEELQHSSANPVQINKPGDLAYVIYTSGTTGKPKGSLIEHRNVVRLFKTDRPLFDFTEKDVWTMFHSYCFDFSVWEMYGALLYGGRVVVIPSLTAKDPAAYLEVLKKEGVTVLNQTPSAFYNLVKEELEREDASLQLRYVIFGGEALSPGRLAGFHKKYPSTALINMYGITETTVHVTYKKITEKEILSNSSNIGRPIPTLSCYVLDEQQQLLPVGVSGELYVGGEGVCRGYLNREELTAKKFIDNPFKPGERLYRSGDKAKLLENGELEYSGRIDDQVKIRGYRIELGEIENALQSVAGVEAAVVLARADKNGEKELIAYVVTASDVSPDALRTHLATLLPSYMLPAHYVKLDRLPLTSNGKLNKKALPEPDTSTSGAEYIAPRNTIEEKLVAIWQEILGRDTISVKDNFFEVGGHSLKATRLASNIYKEFEVKIALRDIFTNPTLEAQSQFIEQAKKDSFISIVPVAEQPSYPISSSQHRLWVLSQFEEGNIAYNMPGAYIFDGKLDLPAFEWCFNVLINRHESLRTIFREDEQGELRQFVRPADEVSFSIKYVDLRNEAEQQTRIKQLVQQEFVTPFNLVEGSLLRATLYCMSDDKWVFSYVLHHIVGDGWSMGILLKELLLLYNAKLRGEENPLRPLRIQYKDYASWQRVQLSGESLQEHKAYWLKQFEGGYPVLELAGDRPRPAIKTYNGSTISRRFGKKLSQELRSLCRNEDATLYMNLLAAINVLLYRYTGQEDIVIGSPIAGREHADLEDQIGFYVNMLAMRTRLKSDDSYQQLLGKVKTATLNAYEHQVYPFDELVEQVHLSGDTSRHALFDVVVVLQNTEISTKGLVKDLDNINVTAYEEDERIVSLFDLRFDFKEVNEELFLVLEYNSDIYDRERIERMGDNLQQLFSSIVVDPSQSISRMDYISAAEKLLLSVSATPANYPVDTTIVDLFEEQVERTPDNIAIAFEDATLTYRELNERANRVAHFLINEAGLQADEGVGILMERRPDCIVSMLGILKAGGGYIPMETDTPEDRLKFMIADTKMRAIISEKAFIEVLNRLQWSVPTLETYLCIDSKNVHEEKEREENVMMNQELWDHVGEKAVDQITGGGWSSSFTGEPISTEEMDEYAMNAFRKLEPSLHKDMRVLEIGCSSGLTLNKVAPKVALYYGTDMSPVILENTRQMIKTNGLDNVKLQCLVAHEILTVDERGFDLIIINSVIQHFHGHNYLRKVIRDAVHLLKDNGRIFVGDVMDIDKKEEMLRDLEEFKALNKGKGYTTKTDFSADLFVSKGFFEDLVLDQQGITQVDIAGKIHTIENELTKYRYDAVLSIDKNKWQPFSKTRNKHQFDNNILAKQPAENPGLKLNPSNLAYVIYTSGTTGQPKGVLIEHKNVVRLFMTDQPLFNFTEQDVWTMFHSYCFDFSVWEMYGALLYGGKLVLVPKIVAQDPAAYRELLKQGVTVLNQTPSAFYNLIREEMEQQDAALRLRYVIFGGEALSPGKLAAWNKKYPATELINMYGITETTVHVTYKKITEEEITTNSSSIGKPIPTLRCYVLDQHQQLLPVGVPGELYVGGEGVARGYLNRPALNAHRFIESPFVKGERLYRSGDKAKLLANGEMEYGGRIDLQVKIRGYRIELGEIESTLENHPDIEAAVVITRTGKDGEKELVAYIVSNESLNAADLGVYLSKTLPAYMLPSHYVPLDKIPLTPNGKVDKKGLPDPEGHTLETGSSYVAPRNETEEKLVRIWQEVLGRERISVKDNFFDLGGHSLKVTRLASQVHKMFDVKLALKDLFAKTILEEQAQFIESTRKTNFVAIEPVAVRENYDLSAAQRRLWVLSQFKEGNIAYNITGAYIFEGELDREALKRSFDTLIERHENLRTVFKEDEQGQVKQFIRPTTDTGFPIASHDLRSESEQSQRLQEFVKASFTDAFDLANGPLLRASLYQLKEDKWAFTYVMHHIISDGWSMNVFIRELLVFYNAYINGAENTLQPLRIQYKDYAAWQLQQLSGESLEAHQSYWLKQFEGELPVLGLQGDKPRPAVKTYNGATIVRRFNAELIKGLKELSQQEGCTLFMGLLAAINTLLYRHSGQEDIITGTQIAGRDHADLEDQIGMYLNTLPLRAKFSGSNTWRELLANVKQVTLGAYEHQVYPFDELVDALDLQRDMSRNPLFDVSVVLHNTGTIKEGTEGIGKLAVSDYEGIANLTSKFDLAFDLAEAGDELQAGLVYNTDIYTHDTAAQLLAHLEQVLAAVIAQPDMALQHIDYLNEAEKQKLLVEFNNTAVDYPSDKSIAQLFEEQAERTPGNVALISGDKQFTYQVLNETSNRLANYLREQLAIQLDDRIGILLDRSEKLIIAILGVLKAGAAYVPVDAEFPNARKAFILRDTAVKSLITQTDYIFDLDYYHGDVFAIDVQLDGLQNEVTSPVNINTGNDLAYVMYTSGSTGTPKGVMVEQKGVVRLVKSSNYVRFTGDETILSTGAVSFDATTFEYWGALLNGGTLVLCAKETLLDEQKLAEEISSKKVDTMWFTAGWLNQLVDRDINIFKGLKTIVAGGDKLSAAHINLLKKTYPEVKIVNGYGPTENTTFSLTYEITDVVDVIPVGKPINNSTAYILDSNGQLCPVGVAGEICVGGDGLARGYLNNEDLTNEKFIQHPFKAGARLYRTGDLGRWSADGNIEFIGRKDEQVKIRGFRIELGEIESALLSHPEIENAVVIARADQQGDKQLIAYVVTASDASSDTLRTHLAQTLPSYMIPTHFIQLDELPLTPNGKVNRRALPDPEGLGLSNGTAYVAPRNSTEEKLVTIWREILGKENISVKDNFFEIGGHSLKATRLASQIHKEFDVKLELKDLFAKTILEEQAELIQQAQKTLFTAITPVQHQPDYGLSSSQRRLWVLSQFEEGSIAYNMSAVYVFEGDLQIDALEYAFDALIDRHEILRTVFTEDASGDVRQKIGAAQETGFIISRSDLRASAQAGYKVKQLVKEECNRPFDLSQGPLLRASLYQLEDNKWVFCYVMHHIISDGWSMGVLIKELLQFYNARVSRTSPRLQPLAIQYKDYAAWQQQQLSGEQLQQHKNYWLEQFKGELPVLEFPADKTRPAVKTYNGGVVSTTINADITKAIKAFTHEQGGTLYMGLLAAVNILLNKYTEQDDIIIGSPIAGRQHADLEGQIGFYLNTLALRTRFAGNENYSEILSKVKQVTLGAYEHQVYPFDELVDELDLQRDTSRHPLFDVMVILQNAGSHDVPVQKLKDLDVSVYGENEHTISKFDWMFDFVENGEELQLNLEYNSDIYNRSTVERLANHLQQLLHALTAQPLIPVDEIDYLSADEKQQLLFDFNATEADYPAEKTLINLFETQVKQRPDTVALVFNNKQFTYAELNEKANRLGNYLRKRYKIQSDDLVAVKLERSEWMIISILAVLKAGGAYLPIDPEYPQDRIDYIIADSNCKAVIDEAELEIFRSEEKRHGKANLRSINKSTDLAYVIYTSGSTGRPKGCMLEHRGVVNRLEWMWKHYGFSTEDIILQKTTFTFDVSVWELFLPLCWGAKMVLCQREDIAAPERITSLIETEKVTCLHFVPGMLNAFIASMLDENNIAERLQSLRRVITSGEALSPETVRSWYAKLTAPIHNLYGPTEASVDVTYYATSASDTIIPIGRPIWNTQLYITGKKGELVPVGVAGEINIAGDGLARGYLNKPELTAEKFVANPFREGTRMYRTGDLGRWLPDGNIEYLGRIDHQVKVRGYRIELGEIENALLSHEAVSAAVVIARSDENGEKELVAYVVSASDASSDALRTHLRKTLPSYMIPTHFVQLNEFPLTASGKIDRKKLPDVQGAISTAYVAPRNATEEKLVQLWQDMLGRDRIGVKDNFFDLGGHSLKATRLIARIRKEFNTEIDLKNIFHEPTIEFLSDTIINNAWFQQSSEEEEEYEEVRI